MSQSRRDFIGTVGTILAAGAGASMAGHADPPEAPAAPAKGRQVVPGSPYPTFSRAVRLDRLEFVAGVVWQKPGTRKIYLSPPTYHPHEQWVQQQARNVLMWLAEEGIDLRFVIHDRDAKFSRGFDRIFANAGVSYVKTPLLAPDANAFAEAWIGTLKRECLNYFLCFSLAHLNHITTQFVRFYNELRPHQSLGNRTLPAAAAGPPDDDVVAPLQEAGRIRCRRFLGGLLRHYYRVAA